MFFELRVWPVNSCDGVTGAAELRVWLVNSCDGVTGAAE